MWLTIAGASVSSESFITFAYEAAYSVNAIGKITAVSIVFFTFVSVYIITGTGTIIKSWPYGTMRLSINQSINQSIFITPEGSHAKNIKKITITTGQ